SGPAGASSIACGLLIAIETAMVAGSNSQEKRHGYHRHLQADQRRRVPGRHLHLSLRANGVRIVSVTRTSDNAPSHRILIGRVEVGAGWSKRSEETGRDYLSIKLDDPSFNAPIYANLFNDEGGEIFSLIWPRPNRRQGD